MHKGRNALTYILDHQHPDVRQGHDGNPVAEEPRQADYGSGPQPGKHEVKHEPKGHASRRIRVKELRKKLLVENPVPYHVRNAGHLCRYRAKHEDKVNGERYNNHEAAGEKRCQRFGKLPSPARSAHDHGRGIPARNIATPRPPVSKAHKQRGDEEKEGRRCLHDRIRQPLRVGVEGILVGKARLQIRVAPLMRVVVAPDALGGGNDGKQRPDSRADDERSAVQGPLKLKPKQRLHRHLPSRAGT